MFAVLGTFISDRILLGRERGMCYCEQMERGYGADVSCLVSSGWLLYHTPLLPVQDHVRFHPSAYAASSGVRCGGVLDDWTAQSARALRHVRGGPGRDQPRGMCWL